MNISQNKHFCENSCLLNHKYPILLAAIRWQELILGDIFSVNMRIKQNRWCYIVQTNTMLQFVQGTKPLRKSRHPCFALFVVMVGIRNMCYRFDPIATR